MPSTEVLYSHERSLIAPLPIMVMQEAAHRVFLLSPPGLAPTTFPSARQLLKAITGHPKARNWTFNRYFRTGRYARAWLGEPALTTLELFGPMMGAICSEVVTDDSSAPTPTLRLVPGLAVCPSAPSAHLRLVSATACGIDLERRSGEVAKLLFAGFGNKIRSAGYDSDEVLQEVYKGILIRNRGTCPWDPARSSFGHYVHMICSCVMSNYHRKRKRIGSKEHTGIGGYENGHRTEVDVASNDARLPNQTKGLEALDELVVTDLDTCLRNQRQTADVVMARCILPFARAGFGRKEIAEGLGVPKASVSRALALIRESLRSWAGIPSVVV